MPRQNAVCVCVAAAGLSLAAGMGLQAAPSTVQPNAAADSLSATSLSASESRIRTATSLLASSDRSQGRVGGIVGDIGLLATAGETESIPEGIVLMASGADGLDAKTPYDAARAVAVGEAGSHLHRVSKAVIRYSVVLASTVYESVPSYWLAVLMVTGVVVAFLLCWCALACSPMRAPPKPYYMCICQNKGACAPLGVSLIPLSRSFACPLPLLIFPGHALTASVWWARSAALSTRRKSDEDPPNERAVQSATEPRLSWG